jgi:hypothetical protein
MKTRQIVKNLWEASRPDSVGFVEMVKFYQTATQVQTENMGEFCRNNDWNAFKKLIKKVVRMD